MVSKKIITTVGASAAALAIALMPLAPAQAATVKEWGVWSEPSATSGDGTGTLNFTDSKLIDATFSFENTALIEQLNSDDGAWFEAGTPIGAEFGASGPFAYSDRLRIDADAATDSTLTVTFSSPVPAGTLGFAVSDIDDDEVTITATGSNGQALTGAQINGTATTQSFNFCDVSGTAPADCGGDTDVPTITTNANDVNAEGGDGGNSTDGASVWFKPSVAVSSITFESRIWGDPGEWGHHDFWIAQSVTTTEPSLANTGSNTEGIAWMFGSGLALLTAGGLLLNRRNAK